MKVDIDVDTYKAVGPTPEMYGHGPVTIVQDEDVSDNTVDGGTTLFICHDCGYVTDDNRQFRSAGCLRDRNTISTTWREYLDEDDYPSE